jgi:hypothetical protein
MVDLIFSRSAAKMPDNSHVTRMLGKTAHHERFLRLMAKWVRLPSHRISVYEMFSITWTLSSTAKWVRLVFLRISTAYAMFSVTWASFRIFPSYRRPSAFICGQMIFARIPLNQLMMSQMIFLCALLAAPPPFWETTAPHDWTDVEISGLLNDSPWARAALAQGIVNQPGIQTYLSSALPMQLAEAEVRRRRQIRNRPAGPAETDEYLEYVKQQKGESIVLTVFFPDPAQLADAGQARRMEEECYMKVGRKKFKMTGHFPPTPDDPYLRLVFPRQLGPKDKTIEFDLYLPGAPDPYRIAEYTIRELMYKGKLEI